MTPPTGNKGCNGRHALWAGGIVLSIVALTVTIGMKIVEPIRGEVHAEIVEVRKDVAQQDQRLRAVEQHGAAQTAILERIEKKLDGMKP